MPSDNNPDDFPIPDDHDIILPDELPEGIKAALSEVTDQTTYPINLSVDDFKALLERLGKKDFDFDHLDGTVCWECSEKDCIDGDHFKLVDDPTECDCRECHDLPRGMGRQA